MLLFFVLHTAVFQPPTAPPLPHLTFAAARDHARVHYPAIAAARLRAAAAAERTRATGFWNEPMVGAQVFQLPLDHVEGALLPGMTPRERAVMLARGPSMLPLMIMASQTFPWPGRLSAESQEASAVAAQGQAALAALVADVDRALVYAFADAEAAHAATAVVNGTVLLEDAMVEVGDARVQIGLAQQADALALRADREASGLTLVDLRQQETVAKARLAVLLDLSGPHAVPDVGERVRIRSLPSRDELISSAMEGRPELKGARAAVLGALAHQKTARLSAFPDVTASVSYMAAIGGLGMFMDHGPYRGILGEADMVSAGVTIPLPVYAPWKQSREANAAQLERMEAEVQVTVLTAALRQDVDTSLAGLEQRAAHVHLHDNVLIPLATRSLQVAREAYQNGQGNVITLLNAVRALRGHHLERIFARAAYARHLADLERYTAHPLVVFVAIDAEQTP
jgi:outer membrane protein TolC